VVGGALVDRASVVEVVVAVVVLDNPVVVVGSSPSGRTATIILAGFPTLCPPKQKPFQQKLTKDSDGGGHVGMGSTVVAVEARCIESNGKGAHEAG
jgi:hypothetical protein